MNQALFQNHKSEIHVWWSCLNQPESIVNKYYRLLNTDETKRIEKFKARGLRDRHIISKGILRKIISNYLNINPGKVEFAFNEQGKPFLSQCQNISNLQFNISHCNNIGIFAFTRVSELGADIEEVQEISNLEDVIELCMSKFEKKWLSKISPLKKNDVFYKVWTVKEAFIKAIGSGFSFPFVNVEVKLDNNDKPQFHKIVGMGESFREWKVFSFSLMPNYTASLVTKANNSKIKIFYWEPNYAKG